MTLHGLVACISGVLLVHRAASTTEASQCSHQAVTDGFRGSSLLQRHVEDAVLSAGPKDKSPDDPVKKGNRSNGSSSKQSNLSVGNRSKEENGSNQSNSSLNGTGRKNVTDGTKKDTSTGRHERKRRHGSNRSNGSNVSNGSNESDLEDLLKIFGIGSGSAENSTNDTCDSEGPDNAFIKLVYPPNPETGETSPDLVLFDMTNAFNKSDNVSILVSAITTKGSYLDDVGFFANLGTNAATYMELQLDRERWQVEVFLPPTGLRTSDEQSSNAVLLGLGDGWSDTLKTLKCPEPQENKVVVDSLALIAQGFHTFSIPNATSYKVLRAKAYETNLDITIEYLSLLGPVTIGFSVMLLPDVPMTPRFSDDRLLYLTTDFRDLGFHQAEENRLPSSAVDKESSMIWRWDLASLPNSTIRIYIDPTVPERWRKFFKEGVEAWTPAFDALGGEASVKGILPGDPDWPEDYNMADARFSTVSWSISDQVASMGVALVDPRSGQIMKADIMMADGWVHTWLRDLDLLAPNVTHMERSALLQGMVRPPGRLSSSKHQLRTSRAEKADSSDSLKALSLLALERGPLTSGELEDVMGAGLRSVVMHETGHILGLRHNFKGSLKASHECLQRKSCTQKEGFGASVMDYLPINLPDDNTSDVEYFPSVIGAYDKLAIRYGYLKVSEGWLEEEELQKTVHDAEAFEVCYDDERIFAQDPYCSAEDLGGDPLDYYERQLERLVRVQSHLLSIVQSDEAWTAYGRAVQSVLGQSLDLGLRAVSWVGGIKMTHRHKRGQLGNMSARQPVKLKMQQHALNLTLKLLRPGPAGLLPPEEGLPYLVDGRQDSIHTVDLDSEVERFMDNLLGALLSAERLIQLRSQEHLAGEASSSPLRVADFLTRLTDGVLGDMAAEENTTAEEINLRMKFIRAMKALYAQSLPADLKAEVLLQLRRAHDLGFSAVQSLQGEADVRQAHLDLFNRELSEILCEPGQLCIGGVRSSAVSFGLSRNVLLMAAFAFTSLPRAG